MIGWTAIVSETNRKQIADFRGVQIPILAYFGSFEIVVAIFLPWVITKTRTELKLIGVDFVLRDQHNRKQNSDFREVQISVLVSISAGLEPLHTQFFTFPTKFCTQLGNVVGQMPVVSETNRKQIYDFRGVQIPILAVLQMQLPCFTDDRHKYPTRVKINLG